MGNSSYTKATSLKLDDLAPPDDNTDLDASITKHGLLLKLDNEPTYYLNGQGAWINVPGVARDVSYFRRVGNNSWYTMPCTSAGVTTGGTPAKDRIWAVPFIAPRAVTLDRIAVYVRTVVAGGLIRLGIYNDPDDGTLYPSGLLLDAGAQDGSVANIGGALVINQALSAGKLYWLAVITSTATTMAVWEWNNLWLYPILGYDMLNSPFPPQFGWTKAQAYGALPDPFPASAVTWDNTGGTANVPAAIFVRLSVA
jgi:hypothetical protein